jgi:hypothetical protein
MEQRSNVLYLVRKGFSRLPFDNDLVAPLAADALSYLSVTRYVHDAVFVSSNPHTHLSGLETEFDHCDHAILLAVADQSFASVWELSRLTNPPRTTVHRRLTKSLGFRMRHFQ